MRIGSSLEYIYALPYHKVILHPDSDIWSGFPRAKVVAVSGLQANAPTFFLLNHPLRRVCDGFVDGSRIDLQSVEGDVESADVKGVEAVAEAVLADGNRHIQSVRAAI